MKVLLAAVAMLCSLAIGSSIAARAIHHHGVSGGLGVTLYSVTVSPTEIEGSNSVVGTVSLSGPAPSGGMVVNLSSSGASATVPASVTVPAGTTSANFAVATIAVANTSTVTITGTQGTTSKLAVLTIDTPKLVTLALDRTTVYGGTQSTGTVTLDIPAPTGGMRVNLTTSNSSYATAPAYVVVAAGSKSQSFFVSTSPVGTYRTVTITATTPSSSTTASLNVDAPGLWKIQLNYSSVAAGGSLTGTVYLVTTADPGGAVITLSSSNPNAVVPATVTVPAGTFSTTFTISTSANAPTGTATITANQGSATANATMQIGLWTLVNCYVNSPITGGERTNAAVSLSGLAPSGGVTVSVVSDSSYATVPATVTVPAGMQVANFMVDTTAPISNVNASIKATLGSSTQSATLTVYSADAFTVSLSQSSVPAGTVVAGTVTVGTAAGGGGTIVALSSDNKNSVVPTSVTIQPGLKFATFFVTTFAVNSSPTANITATIGAASQKASLTVTPNNGSPMGTLTLSSNSVQSGTSVTGTVTLNSPCGQQGGWDLQLTSDVIDVVPTATVHIAQGATVGTFTITTYPCVATVTATISVNLGQGYAPASFTLTPGPALSTISLSPSTIIGGNETTGTVTLSAPAPGGGSTIALFSPDQLVVVPDGVTIPGGSTSANFTVSTNGVSANKSITITAKQGPNVQTTALTLTPAALSGVNVSQNSVIGGASLNGFVYMTGDAAQSGAAVSVSANSPVITVPATVVAHVSSQQFTIATSAVSVTTPVTITATLGSVTKTVVLTVNPAPLASFTLAPATVVGGNSTMGTVTLRGPAGPGGNVVNLGSNVTAASVPATVTVAAGATTATFPITTTAVSSSTNVVLAATFAGVATHSSLAITPAVLSGITFNPSTLAGGTSTTGSVALTGSAPSGGLKVTIISSDTAIKPVALTIPAGSSSASFAVLTPIVTTSTTATFTATQGAVSKTATLTITPSELQSVTIAPTSVQGKATTAVTGTVTISGPAPAAGVTITLTSSDKVAATVPVSVKILTGKTTATFKVSHYKVTSQATVTITATQSGTSKTATLIVTP